MSEKSMKVDMVGTARNVQWTPEVFLGHGSLKLVAPAKVNLFLAVGDKRADGYHEVVNIMHALALHDTLYVHAGPVARGSAEEGYLEKAACLAAEAAARVAGTAEVEPSACADQNVSRETFVCDNAGADARRTDAELPDYYAIVGPEKNILVYVDAVDKGGVGELDVPARDNIVTKAVDALACAVGRTVREKVAVRLEKNVPHQGGLGGGSSDAAAVLVGLARLWGLSADDPAVERVARVLGADVAFFLHGGCAQFEGAGEKLVRTLPARKDAVLLIKPEGGVSTPAAYAAFDEEPTLVPAEAMQAALSAQSASEVPLVNNLAPAAERLMPELAEVRAWANAQLGVRHAMLCGSGATTFAVVDDFATACELAAAAQLKGWWARATMMSSLKAAVRPK